MRKPVWVSWLALAVPAWAAQPVHARHAMVVTVEQHATDAGVAVLEAGGNAVEAAVGAGSDRARGGALAGRGGGATRCSAGLGGGVSRRRSRIPRRATSAAAASCW